MQRGETGEGYVYYRDRSRGNDATVYEHQLLALHDNPAGEVFDPGRDVHHEPPHRAANVPNGVLGLTYLSVVDAHEHRSQGGDRYALRGRAD